MSRLNNRIRKASTLTAVGVLAMIGLAFAQTPRHAAASPPVHEIQIVASRFRFEPSMIVVTAGEPVRLVIQSGDVVHGFAIPKLKIDERLDGSGKAVTVVFTAPAAGEYEIVCSEFCGHGHAAMKAVLVSADAHVS